MDERAKNTSLSSINKLITGIARSAVKLNETIHNTAVACAEHAKTFGDTDQCARLIDALPMSHRRSLVINWFDAFTPVGIGKDGKTGKMKGHLKGKADERDKMWQLEAGKATPFYAMPEAANEPDIPTFESITSNILAFVKRMESKAEKVVDAEERELATNEVKALAETVKAFNDNPANRKELAIG